MSPSPLALHEALLPALRTYPEFFLADLTRYLVFAGGVYLIVNLALARWLANRSLRSAPASWRQIRREILISLRSVGVFSLVGLLVMIEILTGHSRLYMDPMQYGPFWFGASLAILIFAHDAWFYWTHRLLHRPGWFRPLHSLHHKSKQPTAWTAYAFNTGEAVLHALFLPIILLILPTPGLVAFLWGIHQILRNAIGHCGVELFPANKAGRPMFDWLTTVTHHDLHHAEAGWNFGLYFTWWDRWMGTEHPDYHARFASAVGQPEMTGSVERRV